MAKPEWGVKRTCLSCAARFYDLGKTPIICPDCGTELDVAALMTAVRGRASKAKPAAAKAAKVVESDDDALVDDE
ncbi:MAG: TIGR02300 family protein, partial [Pseudomonadota bacterium]